MKTSIHPKEAIILAGGMGTRLRSVSGDLPKPMMPVCGRPFLAYLLGKLHASGIRRTILAVGYRHEVIRSFFGSDYKGMSLVYSVEDQPLGTGGAVAAALGLAEENDLLVLNGDSYYGIDIAGIFTYHVSNYADITIALKHLDDCTRFGTVVANENRVLLFREKGTTASGAVNGGVYVVNRRISSDLPDGRAFSFETDILEKMTGTLKIMAYTTDGYFIDIGIPEDYQRAQLELGQALETAR